MWWYLLELTVSLMPSPKTSLDTPEFVTLWEIQPQKPEWLKLRADQCFQVYFYKL